MDNNIFPTTEQEAQRAANELYEIKSQIRELLHKLNQIEKRLKIISPSLETKKTQKTNKQDFKKVFSEEHLRNTYEHLSNEFNNNSSKVTEQLQSMDKDELEALVNYLGVSVAKKPSLQKLVEMATGRLKESKLLRS